MVLLISCKKDDPFDDDPVDDPIDNPTDDPITVSNLPVINASTHRLTGLGHQNGNYPYYFPTSFYNYDDAGRCVSHGYNFDEPVSGYWSYWKYTYVWEGQDITSEHYYSSSDLDTWETFRDYTYSTIGNQTTRMEYNSEDNLLMNITRWNDDALTFLTSVDYEYDWQIGLYDSTTTFYEETGRNNYEKFTVKNGDTNLIWTEIYDSQGRLISQLADNYANYWHYYRNLKNPFPSTSIYPNRSPVVREYSIRYRDPRNIPKVFANGDLPQFSVNPQGDTLFFYYEELD